MRTAEEHLLRPQGRCRPKRKQAAALRWRQRAAAAAGRPQTDPARQQEAVRRPGLTVPRFQGRRRAAWSTPCGGGGRKRIRRSARAGGNAQQMAGRMACGRRTAR